MSDSPVQFVCSWCGSVRVSRDAWADWDVGRQEWVLGVVFDDGFCHRCERERELDAVGSPKAKAA